MNSTRVESSLAAKYASHKKPRQSDPSEFYHCFTLKSQQEEHMQMTHIQVQNNKNHASCVSLLFLIPVTQSILCLILIMCIESMHHYTTADKNKKTICGV